MFTDKQDDQRFAAALACHHERDFAAAERGYRELLERSPDHVPTLKMLGVLARDTGRVQMALECLFRALDCAGPEPKLYFHLGRTYDAAGAVDDALRAYRMSLTCDEANAEVHFALGLALGRGGRKSESIEALRRARELEPARVDIRFSLAAAVAAGGELAAAEQEYLALIEIAPHDARALSNLGVLVQDQGRAAAAAEYYRLAIDADPNCVEAWFNLGAVCSLRQDYAAAAAAYQRVTQLKPELVEASSRQADALASLGQADAGRAALERALAQRPNSRLWALRALNIGERIFDDAADIAAYRAELELRLTELAQPGWQFDWAEMPVAGSQPPAALAYHGLDDKPIKQQYARLFADGRAHVELPRRQGRPRVGFVVTPGHEGVFLRGMAGMLDGLASDHLAIALCCGAGARERVEQSLRNPRVERFTLPANLLECGDMLRRAAFDLLYFWEVGTDATNYFLPFLRTAPLQCTSWGWPVTSGISDVDLFVSSAQLEPPDAQAHYSERLVQLREIPNYYRRPAFESVRADRSRFGLPCGANLYLCPQNPRKFHHDFDAMIAGILRHDAAGICVFIEASPPYLTEQLRARFARHMPDVCERIRFIGRMGKSDYLALVASADVVLDTPHYGGGANTTYDVLGLGQPLVTLEGAFHRGRYAAATCRRIGCGDLVARSPEQYVQTAVALGTDADARAHACRRIRERAAELFDHRAAVVEFEQFLLEAIADHRAA